MTPQSAAQPDPAQPHPDPPVVPGLAVHHLLGAGGSGEVWLARDERSGDLVALKRLRAAGSAEGRERLLREAALLAGSGHEHVLRLRSVRCDEAGAPVLVLDHAAGGSLAALLARRGRLDPGEVVTVAAPLAAALADAHDRGFLHGDVTPANVLFDADGRPLLADLGLSRLVADAESPVEGTADYLDPAVAAGDPPSPAADVHALAAVCHHMLTGSPPYGGDSLADVLRAAAAGERSSLRSLAPGVPAGLAAAVEAAMAPHPDARPTAADFERALLAAAPAEPVRLRGGPGGPPLPAVPGSPPAPAGGPGAEAGAVRRRSPWRRRRGGPGAAGDAAVGAQERVAVLLGDPGPVGAPEDADAQVGVEVGGDGDLDSGLHLVAARPTHAVPRRHRRPGDDPAEGSDAGPATGRRRRLLAAVGGPDRADLAEADVSHPAVGGPVTRADRLDAPRRGGRLAAAGLAVAAALVLAGPVGAGWAPSADPAGARGGSPDAAGPPAAVPAPPTAGQGSQSAPAAGLAVPADPGVVDFTRVVEALDTARAEALVRADPALLDGVYAAGSPALAADRETVAAMAAAGVTVSRARHDLREVTVLDAAPGSARVQVVDVLPAHEVVARDGSRVETRPARAPSAVELGLVHDGERWRIATVTRP